MKDAYARRVSATAVRGHAIGTIGATSPRRKLPNHTHLIGFDGFVRIRHFGLFAHRRRATLLPLCRQLLTVASQPAPSDASGTIGDSTPPLWRCPHCGGPMILLERLSPVEARLRSPLQSLQQCP